jgi:hypothetical protein
MASSVSLGYCLWQDGQQWTSELQRQFDGGAAVWDSNASVTAVNPLGGVIGGPGKPLSVSQQASPNMSVLVNAGYCAVPHATQGHGVYLFGLLAQGTLTVAANSSGQARVDIVIARVYDEDDSASYCDIEIVEGTPGSGQPATPSTAILLGAVAVASGASSIGTANITDKRSFTVAPGGILPASTAGAPALALGQVLWNTTSMILQRATPPVSYTVTFPGGYSGTWTSPFTGNVRAQGWAGSGGGSQSTASATDSAGGGAEYSEEPAVAVTEGGVYSITVGGTGAEGWDAEGPTAGGDTILVFGAVTVHAHTGQAGQATTGGGTGKGGTGSTNTIHYDGGDGAVNSSDPPNLGGAGGGGAAGPLGPGSDGSAADGYQGGAGGAGAPGGGDGGQGGQAGQYGAGGGYPGGGGGMSGDGDGSVLPGGFGAGGQAILSWEITPSALTALAASETGENDIATSTGTAGSQGLSPASGSAYGWGIGYGATTDTGGGGGLFGFGGGGSGFDADGVLVQQVQEAFTADGMTDFAFDARWGMAVPEAAVDASSPSISSGQCRIVIMIDETILDTLYLRCAATGGVTQPGDAGSYTYYTSAILGTTPAAGTHTVSLAIETEHTSSSQLSGAHVGNLASVSKSAHPFGTIPSYYQESLTAEQCYIRVSSIGTTL